MWETASLLGSVNWDFPVRLPGVGSSIHWYPGTFPNALPATLIQALSARNDLVFDPYGGVGTTGFEAIRQGRRALSTDSNPVAAAAALFSYALLGERQERPRAQSLILAALAASIGELEGGSNGLGLFDDAEEIALEAIRASGEASRIGISSFVDDCIQGPPQRALLEPWFHPRTLMEIEECHAAFFGSRMPPILRLGGLVMLSAVLRGTSSQTASWGHVADNVLPKEITYKSAFMQCRMWLARSSRLFRELEVSPVRSELADRATVKLLNWLNPNTEFLKEYQDSVKLLVTSPPYASAIDYTLSQRLSHYLFGYSDLSLSSSVAGEIGARRRRFGAAPEELWATQLATALEDQIGLVREDGAICVVLPHKDAGRLLGALAFDDVLKDRGWSTSWTGSRSIRQSRTRQSWTSIHKETIKVFTKAR